MSTNYDDPIFDELGKDDRVGTHTWYITAVTRDHWPSGDPRTKIVGSLLTAAADNNGGRPKADLTLSPLPSVEVIRAESASWSRGKKMAIAAARNAYKALAEHYKKSPDDPAPEGLEPLKEGDTLCVHTEKNRDGFVRVVAIKAPTEATKASASAMDSVPF